MDDRVQVTGLKSDGKPVYFGVAVRLDGAELKRLLLERIDSRRAEAETLRGKAETTRATAEAYRRSLTVLPDSMRHDVGPNDPAERMIRRAKFAERVVSVLTFVSAHMEVAATYVLDAKDLRDFDLLGVPQSPGFSMLSPGYGDEDD